MSIAEWSPGQEVLLPLRESTWRFYRGIIPAREDTRPLDVDGRDWLDPDYDLDNPASGEGWTWEPGTGINYFGSVYTTRATIGPQNVYGVTTAYEGMPFEPYVKALAKRGVAVREAA